MSTPSMREVFFNERGICSMGADIKKVWPAFDDKAFAQAVLPKFPKLGLNERNFLIRDTLHVLLPPAFPDAVRILVQSLGPERPGSNAVMSLCAFVAEFGIEHRELSLCALREMTKRFSAEFAIRPFLVRYPDEVFAELARWARDPHPQVRRLVSEGSRPRLPWGMRLQGFVKNPRPVLELLEILKDDPELFVRRSVANNLNDIAKDHPHLVVATLRRWKKCPRLETQWVVKHALRTLLKQGHADALGLLGYNHSASVKLTGLGAASARVRIGGKFLFHFHLLSTGVKAQPLMIDYAIHHRKANGGLRAKVFKLKRLILKPGEKVRVAKNHSFRPVGIRPYYPGKHIVAIHVNGRPMGQKAFELARS